MTVQSSIEDATGDRCVDILVTGDGAGWVECRRDPEDAHGWRRLHPPRMGFADAARARADACRSVGWLALD
ncbi:hypothetical protein [uncultured Jannaschia sp.]|uniref:hypothetical protein n=1 Tax=uncultured Jannaschia sp. TaxID=293347 RepID=UPI00261D995B|nr:hypothetical protein [uncultured Jannaschia sp.]